MLLLSVPKGRPLRDIPAIQQKQSVRCWTRGIGKLIHLRECCASIGAGRPAKSSTPMPVGRKRRPGWWNLSAILEHLPSYERVRFHRSTASISSRCQRAGREVAIAHLPWCADEAAARLNRQRATLIPSKFRRPGSNLCLGA